MNPETQSNAAVVINNTTQPAPEIFPPRPTRWEGLVIYWLLFALVVTSCVIGIAMLISLGWTSIRSSLRGDL